MRILPKYFLPTLAQNYRPLLFAFIRVHFAVGTLPFIRVHLRPVRHSRPQSRHVLLRLAMADPFAVALFLYLCPFAVRERSMPR
jgi:hypothetical protein